MRKSVRIGSSICTMIRGKEKFLTVEMVKGDVALFNKSTKVAKRELKSKDGIDFFVFNEKEYEIRH